MTEDKEAREAIVKLYMVLLLSEEINRYGGTMFDRARYPQLKHELRKALQAIGAPEWVLEYG